MEPKPDTESALDQSIPDTESGLNRTQSPDIPDTESTEPSLNPQSNRSKNPEGGCVTLSPTTPREAASTHTRSQGDGLKNGAAPTEGQLAYLASLAEQLGMDDPDPGNQV